MTIARRVKQLEISAASRTAKPLDTADNASLYLLERCTEYQVDSAELTFEELIHELSQKGDRLAIILHKSQQRRDAALTAVDDAGSA